MRYLFFSILWGIVFITPAQSVFHYIPANAGYVLGFNPVKLKSKCPQFVMDSLPLLRKVLKPDNIDSNENTTGRSWELTLLNILTAANTGAGINPQSDIFIAFQGDWSESNEQLAFFFQLSDPEKFLETFQNCSSPFMESAVPFTEGSLNGLVCSGSGLILNGTTGIIVMGTNAGYLFDEGPSRAKRISELSLLDAEFFNQLNRENPDSGRIPEMERQYLKGENYEYLSEYKEQKEKEKKKQAEYNSTVTKSTLLHLASNEKKSVEDIPMFSKSLLKPHDVFVWQNVFHALIYAYTPLMKEYYRPQEEVPDNEMLSYAEEAADSETEEDAGVQFKPGINQNVNTENFKHPFYENSFTATLFNFEKGHITFSSEQQVNDKLAKYYKPVFKQSGLKKLMKFTNGENAYGFFSAQVNMKAIGDLYLETIEQFIVNNPPTSRNKKKDELNAFRLALQFIDKETLFNTFNGNVIFTVNGFKEMRIKYKGYEYDDDFEYIEVEKESIEKQPVFSLILGTGNREKAGALFAVLKDFSMVKSINSNVLKFTVSGSKIHLFLIRNEDCFILTNDESFTVNQLAGIKKEKQLSRTWQNLAVSSSYAMCWDFRNMFTDIENYMAKNGGLQPNSSPIANFKNELNQMAVSSGKMTGNSLLLSGSLQLTDVSANALDVFYRLLRSSSH